MIITATERLVIRDLVQGDAGHIRELNNDPEVLRYVGDRPFPDSGAAERWIASYPASLPHGFGRWSVTLADGTWIGRCSLQRDASGETQTGYRLLRAYWGHGYATELVRALIDLGFHRFEVPYVIANVAPGNTASMRVAEKSGMRFWKEGPCANFDAALVHRIDRPVASEGRRPITIQIS